MTDKIKGILVAGAAIAAIAIGGTAIAAATGNGGNSSPAPSPASTAKSAEQTVEPGENEANEAAEQAAGARADEAAAVALNEVGGGTVLGVESADGGVSGFEVEIQQPDGSYVEVNLDQGLNVVSTGVDD